MQALKKDDPNLKTLVAGHTPQKASKRWWQTNRTEDSLLEILWLLSKDMVSVDNSQNFKYFYKGTKSNTTMLLYKVESH